MRPRHNSPVRNVTVVAPLPAASEAPLAVPVAAAAEPLPSIPVNRAPPLLAIAAREAIMAAGGAIVRRAALGASARMREPRAPTDEHDERPIDRSMIDPS